MEIRQDLFHFQWAVCEEGYVGLHGDDFYGPVSMIDSRSTNYRGYFPATEYPELVDRFYQIPNTIDAAIEFTHTYGSLAVEHYSTSGQGYSSGQSVESFLLFHENFVSVYNQIKNGNIREAGEMLHNSILTPKLTMEVDCTNPDKVMYYIVPRSLADYLASQLIKEFAGGIEWRKCGNPKCDKTFPISRGRDTLTKRGVGTVRKQTCGSAACKKALTRLNKKISEEKQNKGV